MFPYCLLLIVNTLFFFFLVETDLYTSLERQLFRNFYFTCEIVNYAINIQRDKIIQIFIKTYYSHISNNALAILYLHFHILFIERYG